MKHSAAGTKLKRQAIKSRLGYSHPPGLVGEYYIEKQRQFNLMKVNANGSKKESQ